MAFLRQCLYELRLRSGDRDLIESLMYVPQIDALPTRHDAVNDARGALSYAPSMADQGAVGCDHDSEPLCTA